MTVLPSSEEPTMSVAGTLATVTAVLAVELEVTVTLAEKAALAGAVMVLLALPASVMVVPEMAVTVEPRSEEPTTSEAGTLSTVTAVSPVELEVTLTMPEELTPSKEPALLAVKLSVPPLRVSALFPRRLAPPRVKVMGAAVPATTPTPVLSTKVLELVMEATVYGPPVRLGPVTNWP